MVSTEIGIQTIRLHCKGITILELRHILLDGRLSDLSPDGIDCLMSVSWSRKWLDQDLFWFQRKPLELSHLHVRNDLWLGRQHCDKRKVRRDSVKSLSIHG
jgi:hypothetical protein